MHDPVASTGVLCANVFIVFGFGRGARYDLFVHAYYCFLEKSTSLWIQHVVCTSAFSFPTMSTVEQSGSDDEEYADVLCRALRVKPMAINVDCDDPAPEEHRGAGELATEQKKEGVAPAAVDGCNENPKVLPVDADQVKKSLCPAHTVGSPPES